MPSKNFKFHDDDDDDDDDDEVRRSVPSIEV
jgi:hypothetical protein